ncbi:TORTIFOLIA1-like protein 2 [Sesamum angolense]|uniref:TORTIFOLIA1-like protein 2 n=1 Tax=Sesamum angolense TaxID=2727404 RepID=A0AAE1WNL7_9LAMI|nr:TORTIFOLIA1-like protein 2 [Sesamum angolense]
MLKGKATSRVGNQQAVFELKQRVVLALNKLADRDTYQLGVEELEKTIECLTPDGFAPFLSCILDTDSEKKSAVRKECIRLMGTLATFHEGLVGPHLGKMVASIVKRLKDSDSVVRDACVETVGILASKLSSSRIETDGLFVVLVRPLFEALGEQNKHVQSGSALCLSRVIDNIHDPPASVMQKMLARTVKLLKNPHFMAKPAVIELNRSIILAGGAPTHSSLTAALTSIQELLKNSDWVTRKAACAALGDIASCGAACLGSYRISSIRCLESCRFDKVKPVRDVALQALQLWKNLPGPGTPEPSETGSSVKENQNDESEGSSVTKRCERTNSDVKSISNIGYEYAEVDDKQECSSVSNLFTESIKSEVVKNHFDAFDDANLVKSTGTSQRVAADEVSIEERRYLAKVHDRRSLDSTVTESTSQIMLSKCNMVFSCAFVLPPTSIAPSQGKFSTRLWPLQLPTDSVSMVQSKVSNLEIVVGKMAQELVHGGRYSDVLATKLLKGSPTIASPRLSTCTPRPSVDSNKQPPLLPTKHAGVWENTISRSRSNSFGKQNSDMWSDATLKPTKSSLGKGTSASFYREIHEDLMRQNGVRDPGLPTKARVNKLDTKSRPLKVTNDYFCDGDLDSEYAEALCSRNELHLFELLERTGPVLENLSQKTASDLLSTLASYLLEQRFVNSIVPWLQQAKCTYYVKSSIPFYISGFTMLRRQSMFLLSLLRFCSFYIHVTNPELSILTLVDLINIHGSTYVVLSTKAKRDLLYAIQEAAKFDVFGPAERKFFIEISKALHQFWG